MDIFHETVQHVEQRDTSERRTTFYSRRCSNAKRQGGCAVVRSIRGQ